MYPFELKCLQIGGDLVDKSQLVRAGRACGAKEAHAYIRHSVIIDVKNPCFHTPVTPNEQSSSFS